MSVYTDQRDAIKTLVEAVTGIGRVHDRPRYGDFYTNYVDDSTDPARVNAWEIGLEEPGAVAFDQEHQGRRVERTWRIQGYIGVDDLDADGTEPATPGYQRAIDLAEAISNTLWTSLTGNLPLAGTANWYQAPPAATAPDIVMLPSSAGSDAICWQIAVIFTTVSYE